MDVHSQTDSDPPRREIRDVALLDLTGSQADAALEGVTRISHVATILVPHRLLPKLSSIPMDCVAATIPVADNARVRVFSGQITLSGEALANPDGRGEEMLVVAGQLIVTSPVQKVGFSELVVLGQLIAPTGSETALGAGLSRLSGQLVYYPYVEGARMRVLTSSAISGEALANASGDPSDVLLTPGVLVVTSPVQHVGYQQVLVLGTLVIPRDTDPAVVARLTAVTGQVVTYAAKPRVFDGHDHFSAGFFELFDEPMTLVLDGSFSFDQDIAPALLREKVAAIVLDGQMRAPKRLVPVLQMLCIARDGKIVADDEPE